MYSQTDMLVVMGYGCESTPSLREYLDKVVVFAKANSRFLIFCTGGFTSQKTFPDISEAFLMATYLREQGVTNFIIMEEKSITTTENIRRFKKYVLSKVENLQRVVIFCDSCRSFKIRWIFYHFFGFWPEIYSVDVSKRWQAKVIQFVYATPLDILGLYVPFVEKMELQKRSAVISEK